MVLQSSFWSLLYMLMLMNFPILALVATLVDTNINSIKAPNYCMCAFEFFSVNVLSTKAYIGPMASYIKTIARQVRHIKS